MTELTDETDITTGVNIFINNMYRNGYWQVLMFVLIEMSIMYTGVFIAFSSTFTATNIDFLCRLPPNSSSSIASLNSCQIRNVTSNIMSPCQSGYVFYPNKDFVKTSLKAEFELICDRSYLDGISQSCIMAGFFIGGIVGPLIADKFGRRYVVFICFFIAGVIGAAMGFVSNIYVYICASLVLGTMREITMSTGFVHGLEFIPDYRQSLFGFLTQIFWSVNITLLGIMAYWIREWRYFQVIGSIPILLSSLLFFIVPESPRWLIVNGQFDNLHALINNFANRINKVKTQLTDSAKLEIIYQKYSRRQFISQNNTVQYSPLIIVQSKILLCWTLILIANWIFIVLSYYGTTMLLITLPGNKYMSFVLTSSLEVPALIASFLAVQRGRNVTFVVISTICASSFIVVGFVSKQQTVLILILSILGKCSLVGLFYIIVVTSIYIYPTSVRSFGTSLPSATGKLVAVLVPYFVHLYYVHNWLPTLIIGILACFVGAINVFYPDWTNKPLPETISDVRLLKSSIGLCPKYRNIEKL